MRDYLKFRNACLNDFVLCLRRHRIFGETVMYHYYELFNECETRDKLLENLIDCFDINWLQKRKELNQLNLFDLIGKLTDVNKRVKLLIEKIYFNYTYMQRKAELNELEFLKENHEYLNDLLENMSDYPELSKESREGIKVLAEISSLYISSMVSIAANPDSLLYEVISRASDLCATYLKQRLSNECNLLIPLQNGFETAKIEQELFVKDEKMIDFTINWCSNTDYLLLICEYENDYKLKLLDYKQMQIVDATVIKKLKGNKFVFYMNKEPFNVTNSSEIDGGVILSYDKGTSSYKLGKIDLKTFDKQNFRLAELKNTIRRMFLISSNLLFLAFDHYFQIINFANLRNTDDITPKESKHFNERIINVLSTIPTENEVFVPQFDKLERAVVFIVFRSRIDAYTFGVDGSISTPLRVNVDVADDSHDIKCVLDKNCKIESLIANKSDSIKILRYHGVRDGEGNFKIDDSFMMEIIEFYCDYQQKLTFESRNVDLFENKKLNAFKNNNHYISSIDICSNNIIFLVHEKILDHQFSSKFKGAFTYSIGKINLLILVFLFSKKIEF